MSNTIINVEKLGKEYLILHRANRQHANLRETIAEKARLIKRRIFHGNNRRQTYSKYEKFWALKDVSFEVKNGEVLGIIGRNGAGKSTLLKVLSRITEPTRGRIRMKGRVASLLEVGTGFHPELTGRENIFLNGAILGMSRSEIKHKFDEIVAFAEIEKFLDTPVKRYSSGMYVRLAFAVAAHLEPEILLVDEVLAVGDAAFQKKCLGKMGKVAKEGRTVLFVSHNMGMIKTLCNRALLLSAGKIAADGSSVSVIATYLDSLEGDKEPSFIAQDDPNLSVQILEMYCQNKNGYLTSQFDICEAIELVVKFRVRKQISGSSVEIRIAKDGMVLFTAFDTDDMEHLLESREPGLYVEKCNIPSLYLKPGKYSVHLTTGILNRQRINHVENAVGFEIESLSVGDSLKSYAAKREGLMVSPVIWETIS